MLDFSIEIYVGGMVSTNAHLVTAGGKSFLFDAPVGSWKWLEDKGVRPDALLLTHQHFDHVEDAWRFECPIYSFTDYQPELVMDARARAWGLPVHVREFHVTCQLEGKGEERVGDHQVKLLHVPGHSPDSLVYHFPDANFAIVGDTLFRNGIGRTDLPGGNHEELTSGIRGKLLTLPSDCRLFPGHGGETTPAEESGNPYL